MNHCTCIGQKGLIGLLIWGTGTLVSGVAYGQVVTDGDLLLRQTQGVLMQRAPAIDPRQQNAGGQLIAAPENTPLNFDDQAQLNNRRAVQSTNQRVGVVEAGVGRAQEDDPFAPVGIQIGSLRLTSFVKQSVGVNTNQQSSANGDSGMITFTEVNAELRSQWRLHELGINLNGEYENFLNDEVDDSPAVEIDGSLRLDLADGFAATIGGNYGLENEAANSTSLTATTVNQPVVNSFGGYLQLERTGYRFGLRLRGSIDRTQYADAKLSDGSVFSQADRDRTTFGISSRVSYQTGLAYNPFVQAAYSSSVFDSQIDRNGQRRDSETYELRGGIVFDISEKISGEFSIGYAVQEFVDPGLAALAGLVVDANLNWSPQRDTNVALTLGSDIGGSTAANDSGAVTYNGELAITRRIRSDLELNSNVGLAYTNYEGLNRIDTTFTAGLGIEYWLNRTLSFTADAGYESLESSQPDNSYDGATFMLGVKVQR
ncbi:MAG: outer membrane beta-barrel protein [Rhizobiaceae bacterium]|nr:outer membrane beta-barrel protein [Rhizobiaceae bacterium]